MLPSYSKNSDMWLRSVFYVCKLDGFSLLPTASLLRTVCSWSVRNCRDCIRSVNNSRSKAAAFRIRIRVFWLDPGILVGSGYVGLIQVFWLDPSIVDRNRVCWLDPGVLVGSGYVDLIRVFKSDPDILVGSG